MQTRRIFITNVSKIAVATIGILSIGKYVSFSQPNPSKKNNIQVTKSNTNILVIYDSKFGSTKEVAEKIAVELSKNYSVEIKEINAKIYLNSYDKIIIGSAIQYDKWLPNAADFIRSNQELLATKKVAYFFTCLVLSKNTNKAKEKANIYAKKLLKIAPLITPLAIGKFAGVLDYSKMSFAQRILAKSIFAIIGVKEGDYRDWNAIKSWANSLFISEN